MNEGTPLSVIEAMAAGKPVIATNVGGVTDVVSDGYSGILVNSGDLDTFVDRLLEFVEDDDMRGRLAVNGRNCVMRKYDSSRLIRDMEELYKQLFTYEVLC